MKMRFINTSKKKIVLVNKSVKYTTFLVIIVMLTRHNCLSQQLFQSVSKMRPVAPAAAAAVRVVAPPPPAGSPIISAVAPVQARQAETITITGTGFTGTTAVTYGGVNAQSFTVISATSIRVVAGSWDNAGPLIITNGVGSSAGFNGFSYKHEQSETVPSADADFTLPDIGQSNLNIIVTPAFSLSKLYYQNRWGFTGTFWGNSFGIDSSLSKTGNKMLLPQTSMLGLKIEAAYSFSKTTATTQIGIVGEMNLLWKKVSFFDTGSKSSTNITPFALHPRVGLVVSCFNANLFFSAYYNILTIQTENEKFTGFFKTNKKTVFGYPEFSVSSIFDISSNSKQSLKVSFDLIVNNKNAKYLSNSTDNLIPFLKIGFVSKL